MDVPSIFEISMNWYNKNEGQMVEAKLPFCVYLETN